MILTIWIFLKSYRKIFLTAIQINWNVLFEMPEEEAFAVFVRLMQEYRLRELYKPAMTELGLCMFQLECLVQVLTLILYYKEIKNITTDTQQNTGKLIPIHIPY